MAVMKSILLIWYLLEYLLDSIWYRLWGPEDREEEDVRGKVIVVTGANAGIGKSLAMKLAERGAIIVLGCRNMEEGKIAQEDIMYETKSRKVVLFKLDLEDFESIRNFATEVDKLYPEIHVLINNAGICIDSEHLKCSRHGFELHMCVNHLGHFLLTNLLLKNIQRAAPSRVIVISSTTLIFSELNTDNLMLEEHPNHTKLMPLKALPYYNSKMANSLFAKKLGRKLQGTGVTVYSVCPGMCDTNIFRDFSKLGKIITKICLGIVGLSTSLAADSVLYCILSRKCENESGKFYRFEKICSSGNRKLKTDTAQKLWEASETAVSMYLNKNYV